MSFSLYLNLICLQDRMTRELPTHSRGNPDVTTGAMKDIIDIARSMNLEYYNHPCHSWDYIGLNLRDVDNINKEIKLPSMLFCEKLVLSECLIQDLINLVSEQCNSRAVTVALNLADDMFLEGIRLTNHMGSICRQAENFSHCTTIGEICKESSEYQKPSSIVPHIADSFWKNTQSLMSLMLTTGRKLEQMFAILVGCSGRNYIRTNLSLTLVRPTTSLCTMSETEDSYDDECITSDDEEYERVDLKENKQIYRILALNADKLQESNVLHPHSEFMKALQQNEVYIKKIVKK
jgi:hypothetical protein